MGVGTFTQPDHSTQGGTQYKLAINNSIAVCGAIGAQFAPHENSTPNMTVLVDAGRLLVDGALVVRTQQSTSFSAPVGNPRIDRIVLDPVTGSISVATGTPAASPSPPDIPTGKLPICQIYITVGMSAITNLAITDERQFINGVSSGSSSPEAPTIVVYNTSGGHSWTVPTGIKRVNVLLVGGGGGGGGNPYGSTGGGGGGGGGGCVVAHDVDVSALSSVTVTVGGGGAGGTPYAGASGGSTSFGAIVAAAGGYPGQPTNNGSTGGSGGLTNFSSATHQYFCVPGYAGGNGASNIGGIGGTAGGGRGSGAGAVSNSQGLNGSVYGGGGGGGHDSGNNQRNGGVGATGLAVIWY